MADKSKYSGYNANDTFWDEYHRKNGLMTNREFFTSTAPGGFYEGMEWNEDIGEWVPNAENRQKEWEREQNKCQGCGNEKIRCECDD